MIAREIANDVTLEIESKLVEREGATFPRPWGLCGERARISLVT